MNKLKWLKKRIILVVKRTRLLELELILFFTITSVSEKRSELDSYVGTYAPIAMTARRREYNIIIKYTIIILR